MPNSANNTKFRVESGLDVIGAANVSGNFRVDGDLFVGGNLTFTLTTSGDLIPANSDFYSVGNTTNRWKLFATSGSLSSNVEIGGVLSVTNTAVITTGLHPSVNNVAFGNTTRLWSIVGNNASLTTANISSNATIASLRVPAIEGNVTFDTDLLFLDATNNRIGVKNTAPSNAAIITITGNAEFSTGNTGLRFITGNTSQNASILIVANTTTSRLTLSSYDNSNSTVKDGGFVFNGVNSSATQALLLFNNFDFQYKSGNVAHAGNFGIFDVNGTRVGP